ncbi:unnamed protein product [Heligmosomoides polygyrus]|uniref:GAGA-binding transcriptional activator n=1 Tax=Heligmosomoides polygyrus TaxID=6339 RepID=A0A183FRM8_HELPZ|nr:unnamed protein product [Heligmosomoides polygyrus]
MCRSIFVFSCLCSFSMDKDEIGKIAEKPKKRKGKGKGKKNKKKHPEEYSAATTTNVPPTTEKMPSRTPKKGRKGHRRKQSRLNNRTTSEQTKSPRHLVSPPGVPQLTTPRPHQSSFVHGVIDPKDPRFSNKGHIRGYPMHIASRKPTTTSPSLLTRESLERSVGPRKAITTPGFFKIYSVGNQAFLPLLTKVCPQKTSLQCTMRRWHCSGDCLVVGPGFRRVTHRRQYRGAEYRSPEAGILDLTPFNLSSPVSHHWLTINCVLDIFMSNPIFIPASLSSFSISSTSAVLVEMRTISSAKRMLLIRLPSKR